LTATNIFAKVAAIPGSYKCAIYSDASGFPGQFLRSTLEVTGPGTGWNNFPLTSALNLTNGQFYWLAIWSDHPAAEVYFSDAAGTLRYGQHNYGNWPNPLTTSGGDTYRYSIYASGYLAPTLASIAVTPAHPTILEQGAQQFTATGTFTLTAAPKISPPK
jgi:hypothetical protein